MEKALQDFHTSVTIGGRPISNLRFADDIDLMGKSEAELQELTTRLEEAARSYGMEISAEKSKVLQQPQPPTTTEHHNEWTNPGGSKGL